MATTALGSRKQTDDFLLLSRLNIKYARVLSAYLLCVI